MAEHIPAEGQVGAVPPPGAPEQVSQPLSSDAGAIVVGVNERTGESYATEAWHQMAPAERARHNERQLRPLTYDQGPKQGGVAESVVAAAEGKLDPFYQRQQEERERAAANGVAGGGQPIASTIRRIKRAARPPVPTAVEELNEVTLEEVRRGEAEDLARTVPRGNIDTAPAPPLDPTDRRSQVDPVPTAPTADAPNPFAPVDLSVYPAGSDTEDPSRGRPRPNLGNQRPGKEPSGGFGDASSLQYFALTGVELLALVETLMDEVHARIINDLRFNEALCYPRVRARVAIEVTGFAHDADFTIDKVIDHSKAPLEVAREMADEICFVVSSERAEVTADGESLQPPDAIRQELGLRRPGKRMVRSGNVDVFVDV